MTPTQPLSIVDAVRRELRIEECGAQIRTEMRLTTNIARSPAQLWPQLTRVEQLARWYGPVHGELEEGGRFRVPGGAGGRILEVEAPHKILLSWEYGEHADPLLIRLDPEDDGTTSLRLAHTAMIDREVFDRFGPGSAALGWEIALLGLAAITGGWRTAQLQQVPAPTPSWLMSREGGDLVRSWSVRWAAEAVAAGVDEETALRNERETARAYGAR